jgi:preprotein translocase subunit Sec61beta
MLGRALQHLRRHVVAYLALFVALSGTSYAAATKLAPKNSVGSPQVINGSLQKVDLSKKAFAALRGARGPRGLQGAAGSAGPAGTQGPKGDTGGSGAAGQQGAEGPQGLPGSATLRSGPGVAGLATLDSGAAIVGSYTSATIGADGLGLISYYDSTNHDLKVAHCNNPACTSASTSPLDSAGDVGLYTSVTIGADGLGLISYHDATNGVLKVAHCADLACTSANPPPSTLDGGLANVGLYTSATIGADGLGLISYYDATAGDLKVAHCNNVACTSANPLPSTLDPGPPIVGSYTSVTTGADGLGLISYYDATAGDLKIAHCSTPACTSASTKPLDSPGDVGSYTSATIGADGLGLISYYDAAPNFDLKVAHCDDASCTSASPSTVDSAGVVGLFSSATVGTDGLGLIGYYDSTNQDLKVAHCTSSACAPYFRRR